jgi:hypothetical protein
MIFITTEPYILSTTSFEKKRQVNQTRRANGLLPLRFISSLAITEIFSGKQLEAARRRDIEHFFKLRCQTNTNTNDCIIAHETKELVFYGSASNFSNGQLVCLFSTPVSELREKFPTYQKVERSLLETKIKKYLDNLRPAHKFRLLETYPYITTLQRDGIELNIDWQYRIDSKEVVTLKMCLLLPWNSDSMQRIY